MSFIKTIIERAIATPIHSHLINNDIVDNFQPAYKTGHSCETALLRVYNDIFSTIGRGNACSTIINAIISCRLDYCNSILYNVPRSKTDRLHRIQNQCACILTKSPRREHITPVLMKLHWLKIQDRIIYKMLMLTYKSYYNMAPPYLCELINKKESHVNTRLGTDHHQLIMPPISKDCSNTFLERSFIYAAPCEWNKLSEHIRTSNFDCFRKSVKTMLFTQQYGC